MLTGLTARPLTRKTPIALLSERYDLSFPELSERLSQLEIQPEKIDGTFCIDEAQLKDLDALHASLQVSDSSRSIAYDLGTTFLYRCNQCGELHLSDIPLHTHRNQLRLCDGVIGGASCHVGQFEFIASGSYAQTMDLAHSLMLGLDNPMKGI